MTTPLIFDSNALANLTASLMDGHVTYRLGAKVSHLGGTEPDDVERLDCSGLIEYLFYAITSPHANIPSGSSNQEDWFKARYPRVDYADASRCDSFLRIGFRDRTPRLIRHVWFIVNGVTIESTTRGDADGPTSLPWDARQSEASDCFLLGPLFPPRLDTSWIGSPA